jgi:hypothetical protein
LDEFRKHREELIALFVKNAYHENRIGVFEVQAFYRSASRGFWNGTVKSEAVLINVVDDGDYLVAHGVH